MWESPRRGIGEFPIVRMVTGKIAGRETERSMLRGLFVEESWALISGAPGSGKTTLINWVCQEAERRGREVLRLEPIEIESSIAFSALGELVARADPQLLAALDPKHRLVLREVVAGGRIEDPYGVRAAFTQLLSLWTERSSVVFVLDDAQWIDHQSAETIAFALRRVLQNGTVIAAFRTSQHSLLVDILQSHSNCIQVMLESMEDSDLAKIIGREAEMSPSMPILLAPFARGNPLRAREIGRAAKRGTAMAFRLDDMGFDGNPLTPAAAELTREQTQVLFAAAQMRVATVASLHQVFDATQVHNALTAVLELGYVTLQEGRVEFDHPLMGDAVASMLDSKTRNDIHARIATTVTDPVERGRHLSLSDVGFDSTKRAEIFDASKLAAKRGSLALALQLAYRAVEAHDLRYDRAAQHSTTYVEAQRWLATLEFRLDQDSASVLRLERLVEALEPGQQRTRVELDLAGVMAWTQSLDKGMALFESVLERPNQLPAFVAEAAMHLAILEMNVGSSIRAASLTARSVAAARPFGGQVYAEALAVHVAARMFKGDGADFVDLDEAMALEDLGSPASIQGPPYQWAPFLLAWCNDPRSVESFVRRRRVTSSLGGTTSLCMAVHAEVRVHCERGNLVEAKFLTQLVDGIAEFDNDLTKAFAGLARARYLIHSGDFNGVAEMLDMSELVFAFVGFGLARMETADTRIALLAANGQSLEALGLALEWEPRLQASGFGEPAMHPGLLDAIEAASNLNDQKAFDLFTAKLIVEPSKDRPDLVAARLWGRAFLAGNQERSPEADGLLRELSSLWVDGGRPFWAARAELAAGRFLRRDGLRKRSTEAFETAHKRFVQLGAVAWSTTAEREIGRIGRPPIARDQLSPSELHVASRAAAGASNKEIASQSFMSVKTVESHLTSAFRKLGITRRSQLHLALGDQHLS